MYYADQISERCYGTSEYQGAIARNLKIEDIENVLNKSEFDITTSPRYEQKQWDIAKNGINFPTVWGEMGESQVVENRSKQSKTYKGTNTPVTPIQPIANYWNFTDGTISEDYFDNPKLYDLLITQNSGIYWLSSRYAYGTSATSWFFGMMWIRPDGKMAEGKLYESNNASAAVSNCGIRPIVSIPKTSCNIRPGGTGGENYHIEPKA